MKFWVKIFVPTFILFTLAFYIGLFLISHLSYKNNLNLAREQAFSQHQFIITSFSKDLNAIKNREEKNNEQKAIASLLSYYSQTYRSQYNSLQLFQNGESFNKLTPDIPVPKTFCSPANQRYSTVVNYDSHPYIIVTGTVANDFVLLYTHDISSLVNTQNKLIKQLIICSILIEFVFTILLYFLITKLTKPVKTLQNATKRIAAGEYGFRAQVKGSDEIAVLATHFNNMAIEVSQKIDEHKALAKHKQQFIDNLAHELKTPLTAIYSNAELLQTTKFSEDELFDATSQIMQQVKRIQLMQNKLLDLALTRNHSIEKKPINLDSLFMKIQEEMLPILNKKQLNLIISCDADCIFGDAVLIENILVNLLDNAIKASNVNGTIYLSSYQHDGCVCIELKDQGIGISKQHLDCIFDPFYRTDFARSKGKNYGSAGLGLALCKQIVDLHDAKMDVKSALEKGTTFIISFTTP